MSDGIHPNPWGREYTDIEKQAAAELWPQYRDTKQRHRGPLIYSSPDNIRAQIDEAVERTHRRAGKLAILQHAIHREAKKPLRSAP